MSTSITKIAEMCGVSTATVSFVINEKPGVSPATSRRVVETMKRTGYVPRRSNSRSGQVNSIVGHGVKTNNIGVLMSEGVMSIIPLYAKLFEAINRILQSKNLKMTPILKSVDSDFSPSSFSDVDGVILCNYYKDLARKLTIPFVTVFSHPNQLDTLLADHIEPANDRIGIMAAQYFISRGHKKLLAINPSLSPHPAFETRRFYFMQKCIENGIAAESINLPYPDMDERGGLVDGNRVPVIQEFISNFQSSSDKPTGVFVPCDAFLTILQKSFAAKGIRAGQDVEFIGCNNDFSFFQGLDVRPATIDININAIAKAAINSLLQRITHPDSGDKVFKIINVDVKLVRAGYGVKQVWSESPSVSE